MWSHVECGYDSANETIVFGSRQIAEGDALYETSTIAVIRAEIQTTKNPTVQCINKNGKILLAIDNTFRILSNGCTNIDLFTSFECSINSLSVSFDDQIIIICLNDGNIHCLHIPSGGRLLCSTLITESINESTLSIFPLDEKESRSFIICTKTSIFKFKINNIDELYDQLNNEVEDFKIDFTFDKFDIKVNPSLTYLRYEDNLYFTSNTKCFADCNKIILALDNEGAIIAICKLTKTIFKLYNKEKLKDLMVLKSQNSDEHRLLVNCTTENDSYIKLLSYPNFETIYNLKVLEHTYLVSIANEKDEVMFIEGVCTKGSQFVNELRLKVITESNPEVKLKRLLRRKCFEEAKKLARTFRLDLQQIYIAETEDYIINNNFQITNVEEFCKILDNVKDIVFIAEQCLINVTADTLENIEELLKYAYNRLKIVLLNNPEDELYNAYKKTILHTFFKLDTFKLLYCRDDYSNSEMLVDSWAMFLSANYFEEMNNYLKNGEIDKCTLLFNRLQQENALEEKKIINILEQIPFHVSFLEYLPLLRHIILYSLQYQPKILPLIIKWINNSVLLFSTHKSNWLEYLLDFCTYINNFLYSYAVQDINFQKNFTTSGCLNDFRKLLSILKELSILKRDFGIKLTVFDFKQEPDVVVQILLDEISLKQLKDFMNNYLFEFCSQHKISIDVVLSHYIKSISANQKLYWEETVICIIPFISSNTLRIETVLIVLESADVPWSKTVQELAKQGSEECHPLASKVKTLQNNIPWKILLRKYSIPDRPNYDNNDVIMIARKILMVSKSDMLEDLNIVVSKYLYLKNRLQVLCFNHFVQKGEMERALKYLDGLKEDMIFSCYNSALIFTQDFIFSNLHLDVLINNYLEILPSLLLRLEKSDPEYKFEICSAQLKKLKNIYILKTKYDCNEILDIDFNLSILLPKLIANIITTEKNLYEIVTKCEKLSTLLDISREKCLIELEKHFPNLKCLIISAENTLKNDSPALELCTMAVLLMKNLNSKKILENDFSQNGLSLLQETNDDFVTEDVTQALGLINKLAVKACVNGDLHDLQTACEILNWSNGCFWIKNIGKNFQITPLYRPEHICLLSVTSTKVIKHYFNFLLGLNKIVLSKNMHYNFDDTSMEQILDKIEYFSDQMKQLHLEGYDLTAYHLLNVMKIELLSVISDKDYMTKIIQRINSVINTRNVPPLLDKIFVSNKIDKQFALSLVFSSDFQPLKWIRSACEKYKMNVKKIYAVATLACDYGIHRDVFLKVKLRCEWWQKFLRHCISYNDTFQLNPDEIVESHLLKSKKFKLKILKEFCNDFGLDVQKFLPIFLRNCLINWKPKIENGHVSGGEELFTECKEIISAMENKLEVVKHLNSAWSEISYYQYEVYLCILDLFVTLEDNCTNPDKSVLLMFFKDYRRIKKPQQREIDDWQTKYPFAREIDPLSEFRLPYFLEMCTKDFWEIIRPEINLMTYEKWLNNAPYLDLDRNHICIFAIKGTIDSGVFSSKEKWSRNSRHDALLENMKMCIRHITDLKKATAVLYQAVKKISEGADQVSIAEMCWKKAMQWKKVTPKSDSDADINIKCAEVKRKYLDCLTMEILHTYNVGTKKYLNLITNTENLIKELYQDESIIERTKGTIMFYPDINGAVDELGSKLAIDLNEIRTSLIMEFLQKSCKIVNFEDTFCVPSPKKSISEEENIDEICDNLKRVIYICESNDYETWYDLLSNISFAQLDETISKFATTPDLSMRVKALQCLIIITKNMDDLQDMIGESPNVHLEKLEILLSLESLGYSLSVHELDNCNKMDLTLKILRTKSSNSVIIKNLAKLCSIYDIWDFNLWNNILQCFVDLKMLTDLQIWLPKLYNICYAPDLSCPFVNGWICLIKNYFLKALEEKNNYHQGFLLIQMCPIVTMLEPCFVQIFDKYFENNILEISAMFLPYIQNKDVKKRLIDELEPKMNSELYEKISALSLQGIFSTDIVIRLFQTN